MRKKYRVVTIKFEETDYEELKISKGDKTISAYIKNSIFRNRGGERQEASQFVGLLKKINGVTNLAEAVVRIEQKLTEKSGEGEGTKAFELTKKLIAHIDTLIEKGMGLVAIQEVETDKETSTAVSISREVTERLNQVITHVGYVVQAVDGIKASTETIREAVKAKRPEPVSRGELKPLEAENAKEALDIIFRKLQELQRAITNVTSDTSVIKDAIQKQRR